MSAADFWKDPESAQKVQRRRKRIETDLEFLKKLKTQEDDTRVLEEWYVGGEDVSKDLRTSLEAFDKMIEAAEFQKMLGGEHDAANAILTINSGEGGTDSQDWAEMLLRMYLRW
jgi:peptide chain release factor 2